MNFNRRLRDGATTVQLSAVERRRLLDAQSILDTASRLIDKPVLKDAARLVKDAIDELEKDAATQKR